MSVIIPTHNRADLLQMAIASACAQEGLGDLFDIEVVVVDDASSDSTTKLCQRFSVRYVRHDRNRGVSAARNTGLLEARGSYVAFLDDDDVFFPHKLRVQLPLLEQQSEVGAIYSQAVSVIGDKISVGPPGDSPSGRIFSDLLMGKVTFGVQTVLARREALEEVGSFDENFLEGGDLDLWLRLAFHYPIVFLPVPVGVYYLPGGGLAANSITEGRAERILTTVLGKGLSLLEESGDVSPQLRAEVFARAQLTLAAWATMFGEYDQAYTHLSRALEESPGLMEDSREQSKIGWVIRKNATTSSSPFWLVEDLYARARPAMRGKGIQRLATRRWLANLSIAVASAASESGRSPSMNASARRLAFAVIRNYPQCLLRRKKRKVLLKLVFPAHDGRGALVRPRSQAEKTRMNPTAVEDERRLDEPEP